MTKSHPLPETRPSTSKISTSTTTEDLNRKSKHLATSESSEISIHSPNNVVKPSDVLPVIFSTTKLEKIKEDFNIDHPITINNHNNHRQINTNPAMELRSRISVSQHHKIIKKLLILSKIFIKKNIYSFFRCFIKGIGN